MPAEIKLKMKMKANENENEKIHCVKSKHKEQLNDLKTLLGSISKMKDTRPDKEMLSVVIKKFIYTIATVPDNYFLSDACELTHEMFLEFRIILGYFEKYSAQKKLNSALEDIEIISRDLYELYNKFLSDPGYNGTNFPKPKKINAMRKLAEIVKDAGDVVILSKNKVPKIKADKNGKVEEHITIDIPNELDFEPASEELKEMINSLSVKYYKDNQDTTASPVDSASSGSFNPDTSLLKSYDTPLTPRLYSEEVSSIKAATTSLKMGNSSESVLVAAMSELMAPPPPPPSTRHGRISYVDGDGMPERTAPRLPSRRSQSLRPPILVDDDGDILPTNGPWSLAPKSAAASSIYENSGGKIIIDGYHLNEAIQLETPKWFTPRGSTLSSRILDDDDSFIVAYREFAMKSAGEVTRRNGPEENSSNTKRTMAEMAEEMEWSGWSLKNRI